MLVRSLLAVFLFLMSLVTHGQIIINPYQTYPSGAIPTNPNFTFTDDVDREGGQCKGVIREGIAWSGHFTPPTGFSVTSWEIRRQTHSETVHARGTGNTVSNTFDFVSMDSCVIYDLWATYTNGSETYEYLSAGEFFVLPVKPSSYDITWNTANAKAGDYSDLSGQAIRITGSMTGFLNAYWWQADDPEDPLHIVADNATITSSVANMKVTAFKNVIIDGCADNSVRYGLNLVKSSSGTSILFEFQATEPNDAVKKSKNVWILGVSADGGSSPSTGATGFRFQSSNDDTNNELTGYEVENIIIWDTQVINSYEEAYYIGASNDLISSGKAWSSWAGMIFAHNYVENAGNEGLQMYQMIPSDNTPSRIYRNTIINAGTRNQSGHRNNLQITNGNIDLEVFRNFSSGSHNAIQTTNGRRGTHMEFFSNVIHSTGRDEDGQGVNWMIHAVNGTPATISQGIWNNTMVVSSGDIFTLFHDTGVSFDKLNITRNLFVNNNGDLYEIGGGTWDMGAETVFDNLITTDISDFEFVNASEKDYRPSNLTAPQWDTFTDFTKQSKYADYDFEGFKFTVPIAGAYSGTSTLIADGLPSVTYTITSVEESDAISVANGTAWPPVSLPSQVSVTLSNGDVELVDVSWIEGDYDGDVADTYTLTGTLVDLPSHITNPDELTGAIDVTVEEPSAPFLVRVDIGSGSAVGWEHTGTTSPSTGSTGTVDIGEIGTTDIGVRFLNTGVGFNWNNGLTSNGQNTGSNSGVWPDEVLIDNALTDGGQIASFQIYNVSGGTNPLSTGTFKLTLMASRASVASPRITRFCVGASCDESDAAANSTDTAVITGITPSAGVITVTTQGITVGAPFGYCAGFIIERE